MNPFLRELSKWIHFFLLLMGCLATVLGFLLLKPAAVLGVCSLAFAFVLFVTLIRSYFLIH